MHWDNIEKYWEKYWKNQEKSACGFVVTLPGDGKCGRKNMKKTAQKVLANGGMDRRWMAQPKSKALRPAHLGFGFCLAPLATPAVVTST